MSGESWTTAGIPDQTGRVAVVVGANTGLGFEVAQALARKGARVVLAARDPGKGERALARIKAQKPDADIVLQQLDLASLASVRKAADELQETLPKIDLLFNNAGVMVPPKRQVTEDGFELQIGVNHLGHFAFTGLLLDKLLPVEGSRVVSVSSVAAREIAPIGGFRFDDLHWERRYSRAFSYGQSKLANQLFALSLSRRLKAAGAHTVSVIAHPGIAYTELGRHLRSFERRVGWEIGTKRLFNTAEQGALPQLRAATDRETKAGDYYGPDGFLNYRGAPALTKTVRRARDRETQDRLWEVSEKLTGVTYQF
ncbi:MAG: oxidoreductase [Segniliparus sp.]|uniref:oxidoreductase n=1 Tax=Segniliparus sp. TaxID=2804064 RepID=UPI003F39BC8D